MGDDLLMADYVEGGSLIPDAEDDDDDYKNSFGETNEVLILELFFGKASSIPCLTNSDLIVLSNLHSFN